MIDIKDIQGNIIYSVPVTQQSQRVEELMASDYIQLSWNSDSNEVIAAGSYIEYNGEKFSLLDPYTPNQKSEVEFEYNPQFKSKVMGWGKLPFFFYTINGDKTAKEPDWTLTGTPSNFMKCICDALLNEIGEEWTYTIDASLPASASLSFSSVDILSGLNDIANAFETEWHVDKSTNTIHLEKASIGEEVTLEVGSNIKVPSVNNTKEGYYTRFYAFGSTKNITQDYEGANVNNLVNKRLTLDPQKYPNGYKDIREGLSKGEIFSKVLIFDDVYPKAKLSISNVRNRLMYRVDESGNKIQLGTDEKGNPIYDQYAIWYFKIEGFEYDKENEIEGLKPHVSFQSGALNGREFEVKYHDKFETSSTSDGSFNVYAGEYEIFFVEENNYIIPSMTGLVPSDGDKVVLFNIKMPSEYTQSAYEELEAELDKEIERSKSDLNNYTFDSNPVAFNESNPNLYLGRKVKYVNGDYSYSTRIIKLTTKLDFPIEQNITIGNEKIKGNTQQLKEEVVSANKDLNLLATINEMTQSLQQSYTRTQQMMLEGFAAIKNIWQLKTDENGNTYAFSAFDIATQKGITMYANGGLLNIPSIYNGLPIDNRTIIRDENGVLMLNPNIEFGGGLDEEELKAFLSSENYATQDWVTSQKYASSSELVSLTNKVNDFLEGEDTDEIINKWKELEVFLEGLAETDNLATILATKWTTDDDKIANWDTAFGWGNHASAGYALKSYVDTTFVTIAGKQDITGEKNFTGGLKVNGSPIVYDAANKYWKLEGDLLVTGGISMFSSDSAFVPSTIMDAIATDGVNLKVVDGILTFVGQTGGGVADSVHWENVVGKPTFASVATSGMYSDLSGTPTLLSSFIDDVVDGHYLPLSGGEMTGQLRITFNSEVYGWGLVFPDGSGAIGSDGKKNYVLPQNGTSYIRSGDTDLYHRRNGTDYRIWDESNDGVDSGLDADTLDGLQPSELSVASALRFPKGIDINSANKDLNSCLQGGGMARDYTSGLSAVFANAPDNAKHGCVIQLSTKSFANKEGLSAQLAWDVTHGSTSDTTKNLWWRATDEGDWEEAKWHSIAFTDSNVASATKLETPRTIWGQNFDGTANVTGDLNVGDGDLYIANNKKIKSYSKSGSSIELLRLTNQDGFVIGNDIAASGFNTYLSGYNVVLRYGKSFTEGMRLTSSGNVLIGTTDDSGYKLDVNGTIRAGSSLYLDNNTSIIFKDSIGNNKNVFHLNSSNQLFIGESTAASGYSTFISGNIITFRYGKSRTVGLCIDESGRVGVNTSSPAYKLDVVGDIRSTTNVRTPIVTIDGIQIYKSQDGVLYIDGNLAVKGGITMYGTNSVDVPTIMDAIATDNVNLKVVNGVLTFVGQIGGGVADSVLWDNIEGKPSWIGSSKPSYSYSEISGTPTLLSSFRNDVGFVTSSALSDYLPLSGGTLTGNIRLTNNGYLYGNVAHDTLPDKNGFLIVYSNSNTTVLGAFGDGTTPNIATYIRSTGDNLYHRQGKTNAYKDYIIWDEGNLNPSDYLLASTYTASDILTKLKTVDGSGSGLDADLLDGTHKSGLLTDASSSSATNLSITVGGTTKKITDLYACKTTQLETARNIWGQSFDGTGDITGKLIFSELHGNIPAIQFKNGEVIDAYGNIQMYSTTNTWSVGLNYSPLLCVTGSGNVGIGITSPLSKCDINGLLTIRTESSTSKQSSLNLMNTSSDLWQLSARYSTSENGNFNIYYYDGSTWANPISINKNGNLLSTGGITMYSDQRKKTILNHVELSLKQIADAPLIEHYYNSDKKKTIHVGSIAQYWASMNDWFCKLDNEGFYTMEIQNAALASAISIARELQRYESKTDKKIRLLKKRIVELEDEIEKLKSF